VSEPLLDRMEIIRLPGYSEYEKREIAKRYLWPRRLKEAGLSAEQVQLADEMITEIICRYTREAGVRQLEQMLGRLTRKIAVQLADREGPPVPAGPGREGAGEEGPVPAGPGREGAGEEGPVPAGPGREGEMIQPTPEPGGAPAPIVIDRAQLAEWLGTERFMPEEARKQLPAGVATGLAWTASGGDVLYIETTLLPGGNDLTLTGQLGEVMQESARAARSYLWSHAEAMGLDISRFKRNGVHIHVPAGAIPKDGPSAGITMATALASAYLNIPVRSDTAMTGEISLSGLV